jgi:hypothetical protein
MKARMGLSGRALRTIELMPQYQVAQRTWEDLPVCKHDEISLGVQRIVENPRKIPLWSTFGIQFFLDIQDILGDKQSKPFHEIQTQVKSWKTRISTKDRFYIAHTPATHEVIHLITYQLELAAMHDLFEGFALHDERGNKSTISTTSASFWKPFQKEELYFLKRHPVRCGLMKHHLYSRLLELCFQGSQ